jgi:hypothetical protein
MASSTSIQIDSAPEDGRGCPPRRRGSCGQRAPPRQPSSTRPIGRAVASYGPGHRRARCGTWAERGAYPAGFAMEERFFSVRLPSEQVAGAWAGWGAGGLRRPAGAEDWGGRRWKEHGVLPCWEPPARRARHRCHLVSALHRDARPPHP